MQILVLNLGSTSFKYELFDFDNETSFIFDKKGRFYVAEISMKDEIDFYLDAVENYDNSVVWGEDIYEQLIEKYPEKSDRINEINNNFVKGSSIEETVR